jgi:hypothetical protein
MIIPLNYIYTGIAVVAFFVFLVFLYQTQVVFNLRIRFHGRPGALKRAIKKATKLHAKDNKRYRVFFLGMRYRVYCRHEIKDYKKAGVFASYINSTTIDSIKFFDTNDLEPCS